MAEPEDDDSNAPQIHAVFGSSVLAKMTRVELLAEAEGLKATICSISAGSDTSDLTIADLLLKRSILEIYLHKRTCKSKLNLKWIGQPHRFTEQALCYANNAFNLRRVNGDSNEPHGILETMEELFQTAIGEGPEINNHGQELVLEDILSLISQSKGEFNSEKLLCLEEKILPNLSSIYVKRGDFATALTMLNRYSELHEEFKEIDEIHAQLVVTDAETSIAEIHSQIPNEKSTENSLTKALESLEGVRDLLSLGIQSPTLQARLSEISLKGFNGLKPKDKLRLTKAWEAILAEFPNVVILELKCKLKVQELLIKWTVGYTDAKIIEENLAEICSSLNSSPEKFSNFVISAIDLLTSSQFFPPDTKWREKLLRLCRPQLKGKEKLWIFKKAASNWRNKSEGEESISGSAWKQTWA